MWSRRGVLLLFTVFSVLAQIAPTDGVSSSNCSYIDRCIDRHQPLYTCSIELCGRNISTLYVVSVVYVCGT